MAELHWGEQLSIGRVVPGVLCPKCKDGRVVYNGNYFCEFFTHPKAAGRRDECDWALSHRSDGTPGAGKRDKKVWAEIKAAVGIED